MFSKRKSQKAMPKRICSFLLALTMVLSCVNLNFQSSVVDVEAYSVMDAGTHANSFTTEKKPAAISGTGKVTNTSASSFNWHLEIASGVNDDFKAAFGVGDKPTITGGSCNAYGKDSTSGEGDDHGARKPSSGTSVKYETTDVTVVNEAKDGVPGHRITYTLRAWNSAYASFAAAAPAEIPQSLSKEFHGSATEYSFAISGHGTYTMTSGTVQGAIEATTENGIAYHTYNVTAKLFHGGSQVGSSASYAYKIPDSAGGSTDAKWLAAKDGARLRVLKNNTSAIANSMNSYFGFKADNQNGTREGKVTAVVGDDDITITYSYKTLDKDQRSRFAITVWSPNGEFLNVKKAIAGLPAELANSPLYKLGTSGAGDVQFTVYDNAACTTITKDINGNELKNKGIGGDSTTDTFTLPTSYANKTVYIKEVSHPSIYKDIESAANCGANTTFVSKNVVSIKIGDIGSTNTVNINDDVRGIDPNVLIQKVFYDGSGRSPLTPSDVHFEVMYVDQHIDSKMSAENARDFMALVKPNATAGSGTPSGYYWTNNDLTKSALSDTTVGIHGVFPDTKTTIDTELKARATRAKAYGTGTFTAPKRWIYKTINGRFNISEYATYKIDGDDLFASGTRTFWPIGTYIIAEVHGTDEVYLNPLDVYVVDTSWDATANKAKFDWHTWHYDPTTCTLVSNGITTDTSLVTVDNVEYIQQDAFDVPTLGAFTMTKSLSDIKKLEDKDTADENGNDAGIDVDRRNNEVIVQGYLYLKKLDAGTKFMYWPNGKDTPAADKISEDMAGKTMPYLLFSGKTNGTKPGGNRIENGKIQMVRRTDEESGKIVYEFRTKDLAISPGEYLFVEDEVATGYKNNYYDIDHAFPIVVKAAKRSRYEVDLTTNKDNSINNDVIHGYVQVQKVDKEFDKYDAGRNKFADGQEQGEAKLYAEFAIWNMNDNSVVIAETSNDTKTDRVGSKQIVGYMYTDADGNATTIYRMPGVGDAAAPSAANRPAEYDATTGQWKLKTGATPISLPWGNYAIEETTQPLGYVDVDAEFNAKYGREVGGDPYTYSQSTDPSHVANGTNGESVDPTAIHIRQDGKVVDFTYDVLGASTLSPTIGISKDEAAAKDQVIRGGIYVEKTDYDALVDVYTPEGNGEFADIGYTLINESPEPVWVDLNGDKSITESEIFAHGAPICNSDNKYNSQTGKDYTFTIKYDESKKKYCFESPVDFLPYGTYTIKEQTDEITPTTGYHMLKSVADGGNRTIVIRKNLMIEDSNKFAFTAENNDKSFANPVKRAGIVIDKKDKDGNMPQPEGDATLQGAVIAIWNTSEHSVVTDQNGDGELSDDERRDRIDPVSEAQINEAINKGLSKDGKFTGTDNSNKAVRPCVLIYTDADGVAQTSSIALPYGDYIVREVQAPEGYHVDTNFRIHVTVTDDVQQATATNDGEVRIPPDIFATVQWDSDRGVSKCVRTDGKLSDLRPLGAKYERNLTEHYDETLNAFTTESRTSIYDRVIRGSFIVQKVDEDDWKAYNDNHNNYTNIYLNDDGKYVIEQQGDATFEGAEFDVVNASDHDIITYTYDNMGELVKTTYAPDDPVWHFTLDGNGYYEAPDDLLPYGTYKIVETKASTGYLLTKLSNIEFQIGRDNDGNADIIDINDELSRNTTENDLIFELEGYKFKHIAGAKYQITYAANNEPVANKTFTIKNAMEDDIYLFRNDVKKVSKVDKVAPGENVYGNATITTDDQGVCVLRQLTAHLGGTEYHDGTQYTVEGGIQGTLTVKLDQYTQRFIANLTTQTEYDKYPITEPVKRGGLSVRKVDEDEWENNTRSDKAQGDATFEGAVFSIYNISDRYVWVKDEKQNWRRTWPLTEDGEWQGQQNVEPDKVYDPDEEIRRIGKKKINTILHTGMTTEGNEVGSYEGTYVDLVPAFNGAVTPEVIENYHQEDKDRIFENDMLSLVKNNTAVLKITTNADGIATTGARDLPYGTYLVVETESSQGYMLPRNWYRIVEIREDGHIYTWDETNTEYTVNVDTKVTKEPVIRGDVQIMKYDAELNAPHSLASEGLASPEGIQYRIYNVSKSYTYLWELTNYRNDTLVDWSNPETNTPIKIVNSGTFNPATSDVWRALDSDPDNYVTTITTHWNPTHKWVDDNGEEHVGAYTAETYVRNEDGSKKLWMDDHFGAIRGALPYGTYLIRESRTNTAYNFDDGDAWIFQIREECETVEVGLHAGDREGTDKHVMHTDNYIERNDIWFNKIGDGDSIRMDTMWVIKNEDTGERHVIVTNSGSSDDNTGNGTYESGADVKPHTYDTNANDLFLQYIDDNDLLNTNVETVSEFDAKKDGNPDNKPVAITMGSESDFYDITRETAPGQKDDVVTKTPKEELEGITLDNNGLGLAHYDAGTWFGWCEFTSVKSGTSVNPYVVAGKATEEVIVHDDVTGQDKIMHWAKPDNSLKAFPYGHYTISEVRTNSNIGYELQSYSFEVNNANVDLSKWYTENVVRDREIDLGTITDDFQPELEIHTLLTDVMTESHVSDAKSNKVVLNDEVEYTVIGDASKMIKKDYRLEAALYEAVKDDEGKWTTTGDAIATVEDDDFRIKGNYGRTTVKYQFDATQFDLEGKTLVSCVYVYEMDGENKILVGKAEDAGDIDEQIVMPKITTEFISLATGSHVVPVGTDVTVTDKIIATNLYKDTKYAVSAKLMYMDEEGNAKEVLDANGEPIETGVMPAKFVSEEEIGEPVEFVATFKHVDTTKYQGDKLVAYAYLYVNDEVVARHEDIADESETIYVPLIHTDAIDGVSGDQQGVVAKTDKVTDVITFQNLEVGTTYYAVGELYEVDAEGGVVPVMIKSEDGTTTPVRGWTSFVPTNEDENVKITDGQVSVDFDIDSTEYAGKNIVVYETVYGGNLELGEDEVPTIDQIVNNLTEMANHTEPTDERQTIHYPAISTSANDANTGTKSALAIKETEVVDTISFKNLVVDAEYTFDGTLMTKDEEGNAVPVLDVNGDEIHGKLVTYNEDGTRTISKDNKYVPTTADGSVDMLFVFDATDYAGKDVTVFEKLLSAKTGIEYTQHEDIEDGEQTVHFPEIGTQAKDPTTGDEIGYATENTTIADTVMYKNLVPGLTYKVVGVLYDKETGKPIKKSEAKTDDATSTDATSETDTTEATSESTTTDDRDLDIQDKREFVVGKDIEAGYYKIEGGEVDSQVNAGKYGYWCIYVSKDGKTVPTERTIDTTLTNGIVTGKSGHEVDYIRVADNMVLQLDKHAVYTKVTAEEAEPKLNTTVAKYFEDLDKMTAETVSDKNADAPDADSTNVSDSTPSTDDATTGTTDADNTTDTTKTEVQPDAQMLAAQEIVNTPWSEENKDAIIEMVKAFVTAYNKDKNPEDYSNLTKEVYEALQQMLADDIAKAQTDANAQTDGDDTANATDTDASKETTPIDETDGVDHTTKESYVNNDNVDDSLVTAYTYFVCANADGTVDVTLTFDATGFRGRDVVVFEKLYLVTADDVEEVTEDTPNRKEIELAQHEDITDLGQTIIYPDVHTEALDRDTKLHESNAKKETVIVDKVFCSNLIKDKEYTISGYLVNKATGSAVSDAEGNLIASELTFVAEADGDCVKELEFKFDASLLKGQTLVAFETLKHNGVPVAVHADINDEAQTIYFPDIKTVATSLASGAKFLDPIEAEKINDEVKYENLIIGHKYRIEGKLVDVETGEVLKGTDDKELSGKVEFTASVANGSVFVEFGNVNAQTYKGKKIVVIETLYNVDAETPVLLVEHNELDDKDQTVKVTNPAVSTVLAETKTGNKAIAANETVKLTDKISYTDLIPGNEYVVVSTLVDTATGKTLQDDNKKDITVESTIKPEKATAVINANFSFKGTTVKGKVVVAFNDLYRVIDGQRYLVISEHDLKNANQTVTFPEIGTTATDATNHTHTLTYSDKAVINDEVKYTGLEAGKEYTLTATPYDKATGKALEGVQPVTIKFTPGNATGTVNIQVTVDTTKLVGKKIVMFESVKYEDKEIAVHNDINDEAQTVTVCKIGTTLTGADKKSKTVEIGEKVTLVDTVKFEGLTPGTTYVLTGEIIDKNGYTGTGVTANEKTDKAKKAEATTTETSTVDTKAAAEDKTGDSTEVTYPDGRKKPTEFIKDVTITMPETLGGNQTRADRAKVTSYALTEYSNTPEANSDYKLDVTCVLTEYGSKTDTFKGNSSWESTVECLDKDGKVISTSILSMSIDKGVGTTATSEVKVPVNTVKIVFNERPKAEDKKTEETTTESNKTETTTEATTTEATTEKKDEGSVTPKTSSTVDYSKSVIATNTIEFTPTTADGTVEISFEIDTTKLNGHSLVAFETVTEKSTKSVIATHKDINDKDQTVTVTTKPNVQTGVQRLAFIFALLALLGLAGFAFYARKQFKPVPVKRRNDEE